MPPKFKIGDRVQLTGHEATIITGRAKLPHHAYKKEGVVYTPKPETLKLIDRNRPRTVIKVKYDRRRQRSLYYLGSNRKGKSQHLSTVPFDSTQLELAQSGSVGRPRQKRKYHFKRSYHRIKHRNQS